MASTDGNWEMFSCICAAASVLLSMVLAFQLRTSRQCDCLHGKGK